jgi:hypothetical protein
MITKSKSVTPKCSSCGFFFEPEQKTENRLTIVFCKHCGAVVSAFPDHSIHNSFDLRKIKEKLGITD